jgi:hypothetical protein
MSFADVFTVENKNLDTLVLCRYADKLSTELDGETVIMDLESGTYSALDAVGTSIWKLLEQPVSFQEICREIMAEYDVEADGCHADLIAFLHELADNGLISVTNDSKPLA